MTVSTPPGNSLDSIGLHNVARVYWNSTTPALYEEIVARREECPVAWMPTSPRRVQFRSRMSHAPPASSGWPLPASMIIPSTTRGAGSVHTMGSAARRDAVVDPADAVPPAGAETSGVALPGREPPLEAASKEGPRSNAATATAMTPSAAAAMAPTSTTGRIGRRRGPWRAVGAEEAS